MYSIENPGSEIAYANPEQLQEWINSDSAHWVPSIEGSGEERQ